MHKMELDGFGFIGESLSTLRKEVDPDVAVLGFVGSPWTLATYIVEGKGSQVYKIIKTMAFNDPDTLHMILDNLAEGLAE